MKAFGYTSLAQNLKTGRGAHHILPLLRTVAVTLGTDACSPALASFCVNELPRVFTANPAVRFSVENGAVSGMVVGVEGGGGEVDVGMCTTAGTIYTRFLEQCTKQTT